MERKPSINNAFYEELGAGWYEDTQHPIALLRAENRVRNPWIADSIQQEIGTAAKVLDIGCGGGFLTNYLADAGHEVHGIDLSASSLEIAAKRDQTKSVTYSLGNAEKLPYADGSFDVVSAMDLLEHVERPDLVIAEASRVLKKGGLFFFHTFNRNPLSWLIVIKGVEWFIPNTPPNMHVYHLFVKPKELGNMCEKKTLKVKVLRGLRPVFTAKQLWKGIFFRELPASFRFTFTNSLTTGYVGYAIKY